MIDKITLKNRESGHDAFPYTWDSIVGRTGGTTVKDALDTLEAGGAATNRAYNSTKNVQGYMVLQPSASDNPVAFQLQGKENYIIEVRDIIDLNGENITIPEGCTLKFEGGELINGTVNLQNTGIEAIRECFGDDLTITGNVLHEASPEWFSGSDADKIEKAINTFGVVKLAPRVHTITRSIQINHSFCLKGSSFCSFFSPQYSRSRLNAVGDFEGEGGINSIFYIYKSDSGNYSSVYIEGVDFYCSNTSGNNYTKNINGIKIFTPNGPSRPIVITNCDFRHLNKAIYFYNTNTQQTNVGNVKIDSNAISLNNYGIYIEGRGTLGRGLIVNNTLDQNYTAGIYSVKSGNYSPIRDYLLIEGNILEDESTAYVLQISSGLVIIRGNHYENVKLAAIYGNKAFQCKVILDGNGVSSNNGNFKYKLSDITVDLNDTMSTSIPVELRDVNINSISSTYYKLKPAVYDTDPTTGNRINETTNVHTRLECPAFVYDYDYASTVPATLICKGTLDGKVLHNGYLLRKITSSGKAFNVSSSLVPNKNTLGVFAACFNVYIDSPNSSFKVKLLAGDSYGLFDREFYLKNVKPGLKRVCILRERTEADTDATNVCSIKSLSDTPIYVSDVYIYQLESSEIGNLLGTGDFMANVGPTSSRPSATTLYEGYKYFDTDLNKYIYWDGNKWVDGDGFTPALVKGDTSSRPANISLLDEGYKYFDTTLKKDVAYTVKNFKVEEKLLYPNNTQYVDIPTNDTGLIRLYVASSAIVQGRIEISFVKAEDDDTDKISIQDTMRYYQSGSSYRAECYYDISELDGYTKIKFVNNWNESVRTFYVYNSVPSWIEDDGATAGVARRGTTRPIGSNIYVGFEFFDTTLHKPIYADAISGDTVTWVDATGTTVS